MENKGLKKIVPPLELCQQIPQGSFDDSALVWQCTMFLSSQPPKKVWEVVPRNSFCCHGNPDAPAPTLQEIMEALPTIQHSSFGAEYFLVLIDYRNVHTGWGVGYGRLQDGTFKGLNGAAKGDANPSTAALRLWLKMEVGQ